jgi:pyrroline-5-carboxylate reductase
MTPPPADTIAMIGGGRMALALAEGFTRAGLVAASGIVVYDPAATAREQFADRVPGARFSDSGAAAAAAADLVFLAVKPQQASAACGEIAASLPAAATLVSIVAGLPTAALASLAGIPRIVRVMPNTPCLVGRGVSAVCRTPAVPGPVAARVLSLLRSVGHVHEVDESLLDAVTGLSGSGPGFLALVVEALTAGGAAAGLPADLAVALAVETLAGTGALLEQTREDPAVVRDRVTSPGGTTLAGLTLLRERGVPEAIAAAVVAAANRARELGRS